MSSKEIYDVVVIGGGPVGLAAAYEVAKTGSSVIVLEQNNFFNQAGSSGDLARMFRTMYTENFMADLANDAMKFWDDLEKDAGSSLRWMSGLLNFGDKNYGGDTPEGTLMGPVPNLKRLDMSFKELTAKEIEERYPFKNLPPDWIGLFAPDNGVINVQLLLRSLLSLAKDYGADAKQHTRVEAIRPCQDDSSIWEVYTVRHETDAAIFKGRKVVIASGAYVNHVLQPSFGISLDLDIWEMVASYFNTNAGPNGTIFPSMWFQFAPDENKRSQLFYGFPTVPWGPPNVTRIAVDAATRRIKDPSERLTNVVNPEDICNAQDFIKKHVVGVDATVPAFTLTCLQTNVSDNMFVLDYVPKEYLQGGPDKSVVVFTAGWAMKFVPLLGKALADMALCGGSKYARPEFSITRKDKKGRSIIVPSIHRDGDNMLVADAGVTESAFAFAGQASGSSIRGYHNTDV
ncbi:putative peroxisomal sarcosine oxidase [Podospora aff. communis PSN243]|uniref:Peroxisomal sarcosine oxidase n=1 Tax=Podospora aff. communis PSN243 TaxID=3040156 RepID=A0AAV9GSX8_9PEZI|nr:putative peroxisomal sarcosine oxidase [Podospora aff. communis PSN243]